MRWRWQGISDGEVAEAIGVAIMTGGGPSVVYGAEALAAVDQFSSQAEACAPDSSASSFLVLT